MADHFHEPKNAQTYTATKQGLKSSPNDMPAWNGHQGRVQASEATHMPLSRTAHPVAQFGSHAGRGGTPQTITSSQVPLSKSVNSPYGPESKNDGPYQGQTGKG